MKNRLSPFLGTLSVIAVTQTLHAASATWNGTTDATWATGTNWSTTPVPGTGEIATFDNAGGAVDTIDLGAGVTIKDILFNTSSVAAYTIGSGAAGSQTLALNNSGTITANNTIAANQIFNAKLVLGTDATAQSYSITNHDASNLLTFAGGMTGGTGGTAGAKILNVASAAGSITFSGAITDGGASSLGLAFTAVSGKPTILISGGTANTYTGGTSVGNGIRLNVGTANSLGSGLVTIASGGQVFLNSAGTYSNDFMISGSSWDSAGGALRMGNGATNTINGSVTLAADSRIGVDSSKTGIINGLLSGAYALEKVSAGLLTLGGVNSSIGNLTITAGTVRTENSMTFGNVDVAAAAAFNPGGQNASYTVNINGLSGAGSLTTVNSGGFARTLNVGNGDATSDFSGVITKSGNRGLNLNKVGAGTLTLSGAGANVDGGGSGSFVTNIIAGTLTLNKTGVIALPGATVAVNGGTLKIAGTGGNQIADTAVMTLAGGSVEMAAASQTETIASTTLSAGASSVTQSQTGSVLNMNVITRSVGGTLNFGAGSIATTDTNNSSNGILGGWATVGGSDWAKSVDAGAADTAITAYTGYTNDTWAAANNVTVTTNSTQGSGSTANSLRFHAAAANTVSLAGTNVLTTGGIMVTSTVGNNLSKITGGSLAGAASRDLVIHQNNTANGLTIESVIANNTGATGLTKSGSGVLTLSSTNTYTGTTRVNAGTLAVNGSISTSISTTVARGATLTGGGTMGAATISGILAPGNSIGTMTATGDVTWNDNDAWVFELGSAASTLALAGSGNSIQDMLNITGAGSDFLKGTGSSFTFDFANSGAVGFYKLVDWAGTSSFSAGDFLATNLTSGLTATFTVDGSTSALYLNVVPEPDAATMVGSLGALALLRRRRR